jgi:ADP-ribose pyrophosphatase
MTTKQPVIGIGAVVIHEGRVLLVKRANPPKQGLWCIPGGKVEFGESLQQAAEREIKEETGVVIKAKAPVYVFDLIEDGKLHYVIVDLLAEYVSGIPKADDDADDAKWFSLQEIDQPDIDSETQHLLKKLIEQRTDIVK